MEIRKEDRMQFVTGTWRGWNGGAAIQDKPQCFVAKMTTRGEFVSARYLAGSTSADLSYCYNLALIPRLNYLVAVGKFTLSSRDSALILLADQTLGQIAVKRWAHAQDVMGLNQVESEARDVAVSDGDGSIYVTGTIWGGFVRDTAVKDCFVIKMDSLLNVVYARSFGSGTTNFKCMSIQVTRNADFLYFGGYEGSNMFFGYSNNYAEKVIGTTVADPGGSTLTLRRIILEKGNAFTFDGKDNNRLFFCGLVSANSGDFIFGYLTGGDVTDNDPLTLQKVFRYGSTDTEQLGDCALSEDNNQLVGVFSTNHEKSRTGTSISDIMTNIIITAANKVSSNANVYSSYNPCSFDSCCVSCTQLRGNSYSDTQYIITTPSDSRNQIRDDCELPIKDSISDYMTKYDTRMYSWRTCKHYWWHFDEIKGCQIPDLDIDECGPSPYNTFSQVQTCCGCSSTWSTPGYYCSEDCVQFLTFSNQQRPWYNQNCYQQDQRARVYDRLLTGNDYLSQYMHCYRDTTCGSLRDDKFFLLFEQDCDPDTNVYSNWFVFRFSVKPTDLTNAMYLEENPQVAAYMGDKDGDVKAHAIGIDQYGYVYIHGVSNSPVFAGQVSGTAKWVWLHAKTHWDLAGEYEYQQSLGLPFSLYTQTTWSSSGYPPTFLSKRFTVPKKFRNTASGTASSDAATFSYVYAPSQASFTHRGYLINEDSVALPAGYTYQVFSLTNIIWGYAYAKTTRNADLNLFKSKSIASTTPSTYKQSFGLPLLCIDCLFSGSNNCQRNYHLGRNAEQLDSSTIPSGAFTVNNIAYTEYYSELSLEVTMNSLTEGIYYLDIRVTTDDDSVFDPNSYVCPYTTYGWWWNPQRFNTLPYTQMRRFETSQRVKIIVDDENVEAPITVEQLPDIFPTIGLRKDVQLSNVNTYFKNCDRYYARRGRNETTAPYETEQFPQWIVFYERNLTFVMYPREYDTPVNTSIEVLCCNLIEQCATQTFHVWPQNTEPINQYAQEGAYLVQYDPDGLVGQAFKWEMKNTLIYDNDKASDASNLETYNSDDLTYKKTDHVVQLYFTDNPSTAFSDQIRSVDTLGMLFGQAAAPILGFQTVNYKFQDNHVNTTNKTDVLYFTVNEMPVVTAVGKSYAFSTPLDPWGGQNTGYFNDYFPFLAQEQLGATLLEVQTSSLFSDDSPASLRYSLTMSDGTERPEYIAYDSGDGLLTIKRSPVKGSHLLQIKVEADDAQEGKAKVHKEMLINSRPWAVQKAKFVEGSVGRKLSIELRSMFDDPDGDYLSYSIPSSQDVKELSTHGLYFVEPTVSIQGKPKFQWTLSMIKVRATDVHGGWVEALVTIKIRDNRIQTRAGKIEDVEVTEYQDYRFSVDDLRFYNPDESSPVVIQAYDPGEQPLPSWVEFNPSGNFFFGLAPKAGKQAKIQLRAFNPKSHDSEHISFYLSVVAKPAGKLIIEHLSHNLEVSTNSFFQYTIPVFLFSDELPTFITVHESSGQPTPPFLHLNPTNRTIYGTPPVAGVHHLDLVFSDFEGRLTYMNLKLTVTPPAQGGQGRTSIWHLLGLSSGLLVMVTLVGFMFHMSHIISQSYMAESQQEREIETVAGRFGDYHEVEIKYKIPKEVPIDRYQAEYLEDTMVFAGGEAGANSVITFDHRFSQQNEGAEGFPKDSAQLEKEQIKNYISIVSQDPLDAGQNPIFKAVSPKSHYFKPISLQNS